MVARHPWIYWLAVAAVAVAVALDAAQAMAGVDAARRSWGEQQTVWVASGAFEPGQALHSDRRNVPRALVPVGAVTTDPADAIARQRITPGEIITEVDLTARTPAGLIPPSWVAFEVPTPVGHFAAGDHVVVYSGDQLVAAGMVVDLGESDVMVAIPGDAAPAMATALVADAVTIALTPDP
jgi:hypothetical protein